MLNFAHLKKGFVETATEHTGLAVILLKHGTHIIKKKSLLSILQNFPHDFHANFIFFSSAELALLEQSNITL